MLEENFGAMHNGPGGISHRCRCVLIVHLLCARQVEISICTHLTIEYIEYYRRVINALFSRFEVILIMYIRRHIRSSNIITHDDNEKNSEDRYHCKP